MGWRTGRVEGQEENGEGGRGELMLWCQFRRPSKQQHCSKEMGCEKDCKIAQQRRGALEPVYDETNTKMGTMGRNRL